MGVQVRSSLCASWGDGMACAWRVKPVSHALALPIHMCCTLAWACCTPTARLSYPHMHQLLGIMFFGALLSSIAAIIQRASKAARRWEGGWLGGRMACGAAMKTSWKAACLLLGGRVLQTVMASSPQLLLQGPGAAGQAGQHRAVSGLVVGARGHNAWCCSQGALLLGARNLRSERKSWPACME